MGKNIEKVKKLIAGVGGKRTPGIGYTPKTIQMRKFNKYKKIIPKNIKEITQLSDYVSIKINSLSV